MEIQDKVALVSGGGSGIGRATVLALAARGAKVIIVDMDESAGKQTLALLSAKPDSAVFVPCDVTKTEDLVNAFEQALATFGRLDIVFNNAGIGGTGLFGEQSDGWERVIEIDLVAVMHATRIAVQKMQQLGEGGVIINTASVIGLFPMAEAPVYGTAKAGVIYFTRTLAYLAKESGIRVNAICPELVDTPMAIQGMGEEIVEELRAAGSILTPEEIAACVIELIEDDSRAGAIMQISNDSGREYIKFD